MLEECLPYQVTQCPTAFAPRLPSSERVLLTVAVSRVTKAPFYTTEVEKNGPCSAVPVGLAAALSQVSFRPPPVLPANTLIGGDAVSLRLVEISERPGAPGAASKRLLEWINDHTTYAYLGESKGFFLLIPYWQLFIKNI